MKTKNKKNLVLLFLIVLLPNTSDGQDRKLEVSPAPSIKGTTWVLQNPSTSGDYKRIYFSKTGDYLICCHNVIYNSIYQEKGTYKIEEDILLLRTNGEGMWWEKHIVSISENVLLLYGKPNNNMYARLESVNDTMTPTYKMTVAISSGSMNYNGAYTPQPIPTTCVGCRGLKSCGICFGLGQTTNPYTGTISTCSACGGDGICKICHGVGSY